MSPGGGKRGAGLAAVWAGETGPLSGDGDARRAFSVGCWDEGRTSSGGLLISKETHPYWKEMPMNTRNNNIHHCCRRDSPSWEIVVPCCTKPSARRSGMMSRALRARTWALVSVQHSRSESRKVSVRARCLTTNNPARESQVSKPGWHGEDATGMIPRDIYGMSGGSRSTWLPYRQRSPAASKHMAQPLHLITSSRCCFRGTDCQPGDPGVTIDLPTTNGLQGRQHWNRLTFAPKWLPTRHVAQPMS